MPRARERRRTPKMRSSSKLPKKSRRSNRCSARSKNWNAAPSRAPSNFKERFRNWNSRPYWRASFRATRFNRCRRVNSAATCSIGSTELSASPVDSFCGSRSGQKIGATAGWPNCAKTSAPPKRKSPRSSARLYRKISRPSAASKPFGSRIPKLSFR